MSEHTPEPWRQEGRYIMALKWKVVAEVPQHGVRRGKVDEANAALIADAPRLAQMAAAGETLVQRLRSREAYRRTSGAKRVILRNHDNVIEDAIAKFEEASGDGGGG